MPKELHYNISSSGRRVLGETIRKLSPTKMLLGENLESTSVYPAELEMLEVFVEADHGMDRGEIKDRFGSQGLLTFSRLHKAGYLTGS